MSYSWRWVHTTVQHGNELLRWHKYIHVCNLDKNAVCTAFARNNQIMVYTMIQTMKDLKRNCVNGAQRIEWTTFLVANCSFNRWNFAPPSSECHIYKEILTEEVFCFPFVIWDLLSTNVLLFGLYLDISMSLKILSWPALREVGEYVSLQKRPSKYCRRRPCTGQRTVGFYRTV